MLLHVGFMVDKLTKQDTFFHFFYFPLSASFSQCPAFDKFDIQRTVHRDGPLQ